LEKKQSSRKSIAVIGSGISGLSCAYHLHKEFDVTVFEKESYLGGHTDTHELIIDNQAVRIDSGFIVFCRLYYPNFSAMLDELGVTSHVTEMSFSAHNQKTGLVYNATSINRLFCQRKNLINLRFYRMLWDLSRFYLTTKKNLTGTDTSTTVQEYLEKNNYSSTFSEDHLYPMISALWSATPERVKLFPIRHLIEFLSSHGMLNLLSRPEWRVISNGSKSYIEAIANKVNCQWKLNSQVKSIERFSERKPSKEIIVNVQNTKSNEFISESFNYVIFACHADQALKLLDSPSKQEQAILECIQFETNHMTIHTDESIMHPNKLSWASWNTEVPNQYKLNTLKCCTANYWMNCLQTLPTKKNIFASLNSHQTIDPNKILIERNYTHPVFTPSSVAALKQKHLIDGQKNTYYAGAYWGWGFHEDGARSAVDVSNMIKARL